MRAINALACGAALALSAGPSVGQPAEVRQLFSVRTQGAGVVKGEVDLSGVAFAVTPDALVTAPRAIGSSQDFKAVPQFAESGVPSRTIALKDLRDESSAVVPARVRSSDGRVAVLVRDGQQPELTPLPLSACALENEDHSVLASNAASATDIQLRPVFADGAVTHFAVRSPQDGWTAALKALGAPVLNAEGRVAGVLTDAAPDGRNVEVTPVAEVADLLPEDAAMDCDPRVSTRAFARLAALEADVRALSSRVNAAEQTARLAMGALADVGTDLQALQDALASNGDINAPIESMKTRLRTTAPLVPTVSDIEAFLRKPTWTARAKFEGDLLHLTFTYRTQLPGSLVSNRLRLCMRLVKPFHSEEAGHQNFRTPDFYSAAMREDEVRLVRCNQANVANSAGRTDTGEYKFEVFRDDLEAMFAAYREDKDWLPTGYDWRGLTYAVLMKPDTDPEAAADGGGESQEGEVILRALIIVPEARADRSGALQVQCVLFDNDQSVIDFLAQRAPRPAGAALDDVSDLELDPRNTSDECVLASAL